MASHKGHLYFLELVKELVGKKLPVRVCLIGDGPERANITKWIGQNGLTAVVTLTGVISNVEEMIPAFDICALLSEYEGMPNSVIEAMAYGKPVVAHPVGNVPELFEGGAGIVVAQGDKRQALEHLEELINKPELRARIGDEARKRIAARFSLDATVVNLLNLYAE
jgi:glycosyltransferase involved in cell wall biosynthesis